MIAQQFIMNKLVTSVKVVLESIYVTHSRGALTPFHRHRRGIGQETEIKLIFWSARKYLSALPRIDNLYIYTCKKIVFCKMELPRMLAAYEIRVLLHYAAGVHARLLLTAGRLRH